MQSAARCRPGDLRKAAQGTIFVAMATAPYGSWKSPITSTLIVERSIGLLEVWLDGDAIYWLEQRPRENRAVVVRGASQPRDVVAAPFNVRTRVHEYGGGAWTVADGTLYFSNDQDRRLYRQRGDEQTPQPLTPEGPWRYADGVIDRARRRWIGVREDHASGQLPENTIVAVDLDTPGSTPGTVLAAGHDFFSSPRLSPDGRRLAWIAWDHPNMPWVGTTLYLAELDAAGSRVGEPVAIAGGPAESIVQPEWSPDGSTLVFAADRSGWWNLHSHDVAGRATRRLVAKDAEFAQAQWIFGMSSYAFVGGDRLIASYVENGVGRLALVDLASGRLTDIDVPFSEFWSMRADGGDLVVFCAGAYDRPASVVQYDLGSRTHRVLQQANTVADDPELRKYLARPQAVAFPTEAGATAYGLFYPATNPDHEAPAGEKPPLLVKCHGGPTSSASSVLNLNTQYWTSRGIAVLDLNYGGSTGYGREYRNRLHLSWGIVDVDDAVNGARFLGEQGLIDASRAVIAGGSAGGFTALAALTFRDVFAGGASYYGVSDLAALAQDTHKFESRYLDWLIGPYPQAEAIYRARSPLFHAERLSRPVIFFQGSEDRVVPPDQTAKMVEALRRRQVPVGFLQFAGEQHGFRRAANIQRALDAELYFYAFEVFHTELNF
jgi:dipeptidyl aminopeptidase/acylaminoacyl peptidase